MPGLAKQDIKRGIVEYVEAVRLCLKYFKHRRILTP